MVKKIFKKNHIIITALAIMIAIAGYLNYSGRFMEEEANVVNSGENAVLLTTENAGADTYVESYEDIVSLDEDTQEASADIPESSIGEAVLASASIDTSLLAEAKLNREQVRAKSKEALLELINNNDVGEEQKQEAIEVMTNMASAAEQEAAAELLLDAKGFAGSVVSISNGNADVVVQKSMLNQAECAQIEDIVRRKTNIPGENIIITPAATVEEQAVENQSEENQ